VVTVGVVVVLIVVTAGMVSTTWVQFIKGSLLVFFCSILTVLILQRGFRVEGDGALSEPQKVAVVNKDGKSSVWVNGAPQGNKAGEHDLQPGGRVVELPGGVRETGPLGPFEYFSVLSRSKVELWKAEPKKTETMPDGSPAEVTTYQPRIVEGSATLLPGQSPTFQGLTKDSLPAKLDFISLMLALFCGTASLPHILIRYYTVKDQISVRKSTVVGIAAIGFFYILTLFLGFGAMTSGALDITNSNMAAPLLARTFGEMPFALISAIAFTTVLGTVSGLIIASAGAVVHDLASDFAGVDLSDEKKVLFGKAASVVVGVVAIVLGILFEKFNVTFLVGWAFNIAASANLPALVMLLFWPGTTKRGVMASVLVGMTSSLAWVLLSQEAMQHLYGLDRGLSPVPFSQPGLVTIPLSFAVLVGVSLLTRRATPAGQAT
jgi:cation/acetate symporter